MLQNDFADMLRHENLHPWYYNQDLYGVVDVHYRIDFNHDFDKLDRNTVEKVRKSYLLRARWFREFLEADEDPVYFVRRWHPRDGDEDEAKALTLFEFLKNRRRDIRFLYLHNDESRHSQMLDGYRSTYLRQHRPFQWTGDQAAWHYILNNFAVRPFDGDRDAFVLPDRKLPRFR